MDIQTHNFEKSKNALKEFSKIIPTDQDLPRVDTHVFFGLFERDVSGSDLNNLTAKIQGHLVKTNGQVIKLIEQFEQIYNTFESLDKDYIQGIITAIKSAEISSSQAREAALKAFDAANNSENNTCDIKILIKNQSDIIDKLIEFKKRIENIPNIDKISAVWEYVDNLKKENQIIWTKINEIETCISEREKYLFDAQTEIKERFSVQDKKISLQNEEIISLIDKNKNDLSQYLINMNVKQLQNINDIATQLEKFQIEIKKNYIITEERFVSENMKLRQTIKVANVVAGIFGAITLTHVLLTISGIV